jgi:hypothetical protein
VPDVVVHSVVLIVDDPAGVATPRGRDRVATAVSAVAEDATTIDQVGHGVAGHDDVGAIAGPAWADGNRPTQVRADDDLRVEAAGAVLAERAPGYRRWIDP